MDEHGRRELAEAVPEELASRRVALGDADAPVSEHDDGPVAAPARGDGRVDAPLGVREAVAARRRERIVAAPSRARGREPVVGREPMHRGAHGALVDAEGGEPADQAAEPDHAAVRHDGVAEHRVHQRGGSRRPGGEHASQSGVDGRIARHVSI